MSDLGPVSRARARITEHPVDSLLALIAVLVTAWALLAPFLVVKYPPLNDLPMNASITSIFRHWFDPAWHFREQFQPQFLQMPTLTNYVVGAFLALFLPISWAVKISSLLLIALLPLGLAVYLHGMKKDPLGGVAAAGFAWASLVQWGFISYVGGLGLMLLGLGVTLMVLDRPTRGRALALGATALLLLVTHISHFPFFCLAIGLTTLCMWPATRRLSPVVLPVVPAGTLFVVWWFLRPADLRAPVETGWHFERLAKIDHFVFEFGVPESGTIAIHMGVILAVVSLYSLAVNVLTAWRRGLRRPQISLQQGCAWAGGLLVSLSFAVLYFWLPEKIGVWWFVAPRHMSAALLCALVLLPNLPANPWLRAPALGGLLVAIVLPMRAVTARFAAFEAGTQDFQQIIAQLPRAPKLGYMIWDNKDFSSHVRPLLHLPAWVQAEKGGWLSFHFATWNAAPFGFRRDDPKDVAPDTPARFEWTPDKFDVQTRGKYFNWFLVHSHESKEATFAVDPTLHLVDHRGDWWLYERGQQT